MTNTQPTPIAEVTQGLGEPSLGLVDNARHALQLLDDANELVTFCAVNMLDVERYKRGSIAFWRVAHWIAAIDHRLTALADAERKLEEARGLLRELADDLETEVEARRTTELERRVERDLEPVHKARAFLAQDGGKAG